MVFNLALLVNQKCSSLQQKRVITTLSTCQCVLYMCATKNKTFNSQYLTFLWLDVNSRKHTLQVSSKVRQDVFLQMYSFFPLYNICLTLQAKHVFLQILELLFLYLSRSPRRTHTPSVTQVGGGGTQVPYGYPLPTNRTEQKW